MNNIKNNNVRAFYTRLINDEYWDLMLFKGEAANTEYSGLTTECLSSYIDFNDPDCISESGDTIYSKADYTWENAVNDGILMEHAGITGVDNGLFTYDKKKISNTEFLDIFLSRTSAGTFSIEENDTRLALRKIDGNTQEYCYNSSIDEDESGKYLSLKGGFYQGFFKLYGYNYQTLPNVIDDDWHFEFNLRRRSDYETSACTINSKHPENAGTFFYIGSRAENKFGELYNGTYSLLSGSMIDLTDIIEYDYLAEDPYLESNDGYLADEDFFGVPIDQYMESISAVTSFYESAMTDSTMDEFEVETDNKFLLFDHTPDGFTTKTWNEDAYDSYVVEGAVHNYHTNPFLIFDHTISGYTSKDVISGRYQEDFKAELSYSMSADSTSNSFGMKINDDGSLSYSYITCDEHSGRTVMNETTKDGLIPDNEWCTVNIRFKALNGYVDSCGNQHPQNRKMRLYIYVNGFLIFVSKDLPVLNLTELNDKAEKQEGVPYNISIGGGSQGLMERIWFDFFDLPTEVYDIEKNFAGTFIGDIKSFRMYSCNMDIESIRSNYKYDQSNIII